MTTEQYPMQPLVEEDGVLRFERNPIVEMLVDRAGMNEIAIWCADRETDPKYQEQLAQLIGYSTSGYCGLSYVSDASQIRVERAIKAFNDRLNGGLPDSAVAENLRTYIKLWDPVDAYVRRHPSVKLGVSVPEAALRLLQEGDEAVKKLAALEEEHKLELNRTAAAAEKSLDAADREIERRDRKIAELTGLNEELTRESKKRKEYIDSIADNLGMAKSMLPIQTTNRINYALVHIAKTLGEDKLTRATASAVAKRLSGMQTQVNGLHAIYEEAVREKQAAVDRYQRDVYGLNNEGDPIGGEPAGGFANELRECRFRAQQLQTRLNLMQRKELVDFVRDGESAYLVKAERTVPDEVATILERIVKWDGEFPETGKFYKTPDGSRQASYAELHGSNGERDFMRGLAATALGLLRAPSHSQQSADTDRLRAFADEVKQLCSDFSDLQNRPYMGDVTSAIDGLYEQFNRRPSHESDEFVRGDQLLNPDLAEADVQERRQAGKPSPKFVGLAADPEPLWARRVIIDFSEKLDDAAVRELTDLIASRFTGDRS